MQSLSFPIYPHAAFSSSIQPPPRPLPYKPLYILTNFHTIINPLHSPKKQWGATPATLLPRVLRSPPPNHYLSRTVHEMEAWSGPQTLSWASTTMSGALSVRAASFFSFSLMCIHPQTCPPPPPYSFYIFSFVSTTSVLVLQLAYEAVVLGVPHPNPLTVAPKTTTRSKASVGNKRPPSPRPHTAGKKNHPPTHEAGKKHPPPAKKLAKRLCNGADDLAGCERN